MSSSLLVMWWLLWSYCCFVEWLFVVAVDPLPVPELWVYCLVSDSFFCRGGRLIEVVVLAVGTSIDCDADICAAVFTVSTNNRTRLDSIKAMLF